MSRSLFIGEWDNKIFTDFSPESVNLINDIQRVAAPTQTEKKCGHDMRQNN